MEQLSKDNFYQLLSRFTTPELEGLVQKFPYFHQAHLLLAKKYQQESNPRFDEQLQMAALYTQSRELFYDIFHEQLKSEEAVAAFVPEVTEVNEPVKEFVAPEVSATPETETVIEEIATTNSEVETPGTETLETVTLTEPEQLKPVEIATVEAEIEERAQEQEEEIGMESVNEEVETATVQQQQAATTEEEIAVEPEEEITLDEPHTFDEWLHAFPIKTTVKEAAKALENNELEEDDLERIILENANVDYLHTRVEEETHYSKGLDKFIDEQKQRHRPVEIKKIEKHGDLDPALITETLAGLYAAQRKYSKAIKAYELLSLKFPEKSDLFAARIQYLKKLI